MKKEKGKKIFSHKGASDFDIIHVHKLTHFTDHIGNYLTKTGHKIDDFSLDPTTEKSHDSKINLKQVINRRISMTKNSSNGS